MKRVRFTDEQIVRILQEADQSPVVEVDKRHGISEPSIYAWRKKLGDLGTDDVKRLKQLQQGNNRLKKILAERDLEIELMKEIAAKNGKRTGAYRASSVCHGSKCDPATRLYADECCEIRVGLCVQDAPQRCACD
jgi:putative transposase